MSHVHEDQVISVQSYFVKKRELKRPVKWGFLVTPGFSYHDGPRHSATPAEPGERKKRLRKRRTGGCFSRSVMFFVDEATISW